jgi:hypothetical protein
MHIINYIFRQDGQHRYAYDAETLGQILAGAGFSNVRVREFDPALDSARRADVNSLYMEARVPEVDRDAASARADEESGAQSMHAGAL